MRRWAVRPLRELLDIQNGFAFDSKRFSHSSGVPLIRIRDLKNGINTEARYTGDFDEHYVVNTGDLLVGMDGEFGCYRWNGGRALLNQRVCRLRSTVKDLDESFLFYGLNSHLKAIEDVTSYTTVKHISSKQILNIEFPVPPLPEQKRIVKILDEASAGITAAKANAEKNYQNAREIFESRLDSIFNQEDKNWTWDRLGDVCKTRSGGTPLKTSKEYYEGGNIPWLMSGEVSQGEVFAATRFITQKGLENSSAKIFPENTVLVAMYGATAGEVGILRFESATNQAVCGILPNPMFIPEFIFFVLWSKKRELIAQATGNAQPNISQDKIKKTRVPSLSIKEQQRIVDLLSELDEETKRLSSLQERKIEVIAEFKKSLLHQAFSGKL